MQDKRNIENVVQEIMNLVIKYGEACCENNELGSVDREHEIESKLRDLMLEQEEEIRVAVARYNLASEIIETRSKERAHNITKDS